MALFKPVTNLLFVGMVAGLMLAGCASDPTPSTTEAPSTSMPTASVSSTDQTDIGTLIDVRTPEEFSEGHLDGAINLDVSAFSFADEIAKLNKDDTYTVYCRSGNRSAQAVKQMNQAGFTHVVDAGGYDEAKMHLGLETVTD
ncbi:rhodanese-like domain-containing protein [Stomatohabitans albus]|uniref:rhodanese-like domain-containing protein n=1 Tax=Stomatohabitans albus TaxID=3110766 RepID=UPI00300DAE94